MTEVQRLAKIMVLKDMRKEYELRAKYNGGVDYDCYRALDMAIEALEQTRWIPVSERLPEMGVRVLCACQADLYDILKLTPEGWFYDTRHTYMFGFVRAWMPLPLPWKGE